MIISKALHDILYEFIFSLRDVHYVDEVSKYIEENYNKNIGLISYDILCNISVRCGFKY